MNKLLLTSTFVIGLAAGQMANALPLTWSGSVGGTPTGAKKVNFDNLTANNLPNAWVAVSGETASGPNGSLTLDITSDGRIVTGAVANKYAAPYLSGDNGSGFGTGGTDQPDGADDTTYITTGLGSVTLTFSSPQKYMGLLWGSIDPYNTLSFYRQDNTLIQSLTGSQVNAGANGNQSVEGTLYVNINSTDPFAYVVATSSEYAFEFDNVAYNDTPLYVPDGGTTAALLGLGLTGLGFLARRKV